MASTQVSPAMRNQMHSLPSCSTTGKSSSKLYQIMHSIMQLVVTIFIAIQHRPVSTSSCLQLFRLSVLLPAVAHSLPSYLILSDHRSSLAMPNAIHRCTCSQEVDMVAIAYVAVARFRLLERKTMEHRQYPDRSARFCLC